MAKKANPKLADGVASTGGTNTGTTTSGANGGATITNTYLERTQEYIAVNRNDLDDIFEFDLLEVGFSGIGMFLLSGALWLFIEKSLEEGEFSMSPLLWVCGLSIIVGIILLFVGYRMHNRKTSRLQRIFNETREVTNRDDTS